MNKNKKIIIITIISVIVILAVVIGLYFIIKLNNENKKVGKLNNYYEKLINTNMYEFYTELNNENNEYYAKQENKAYINLNYKGKKFEYIIRDGDTNLIMDDEKQYYTYINNEAELYKIESQIKDIKDNEAIVGNEKIEKERYKYEEYNGITEFYIGSTDDINEENVKTRFYFDGDDLKYIKTIIDQNNQQTLKVKFSENVDNKLFDIPSDYKKMS